MKMLEAKLTQTPHSSEVYSTAEDHHQDHHKFITTATTWCEEVHTSKGDRGDGNVAEEEHGVGDAQGGQQQVEHIVHLPKVVQLVEMEWGTWLILLRQND